MSLKYLTHVDVDAMEVRAHAWLEERSAFPRRDYKLVPGEKFMPAGIPELLSLTGLTVQYSPGGWHQGARRLGKWRMWKPGAALHTEEVRERDPAECWREAVGRILDYAKQVQHSDDHA